MVATRARHSVPFRVELPGGRSLVVRPVSSADVDDLTALYEGLPDEDLYRRFFQAHVPPRHAIERMTEAEDRGDIGLVAEMDGGDGCRTLVGEVGCARLPDGDGELAIAVTPSARGWIGPFLLALLCDEAAARGIPNLQADVLADNRPMLALAQARGYATMDHSECPSIVRVVFSTSGRVPTWPARHDRPRVVVEAPGARWHAEGATRAAGMDLLVCPGPSAKWSRCPAVTGGRCPLAAAADLVVDAIDPESSEAGRRLLEEHRKLHPDTLLYVEPSGRTATGESSAPVLGLPGAFSVETAEVVDDLQRLLGQGRSAHPANEDVR